MARFHFRLQPALECARQNETLARRVVVDARIAFDDVCALLAAVELRISELRAPVAAATEASAGSFAAVEAAVIALGALQRRRRSEAGRARLLLERAREVYARASAERGALERLRERRLLEFNLSAEAAETAGFDEANGIRANALAARSNEAERTGLRKFTL